MQGLKCPTLYRWTGSFFHQTSKTVPFTCLQTKGKQRSAAHKVKKRLPGSHVPALYQAGWCDFKRPWDKRGNKYLQYGFVWLNFALQNNISQGSLSDQNHLKCYIRSFGERTKESLSSDMSRKWLVLYLPLVVLNASQEQIDLWGTDVEDWLKDGTTAETWWGGDYLSHVVLKKSSAGRESFTQNEFHLQMSEGGNSPFVSQPELDDLTKPLRGEVTQPRSWNVNRVFGSCLHR